ncbi:MAG TPA: Ig-like domain-containing protein [Clostridia bacterium]|nr:Ig-like domain-containing protein [Clostridia bacterium]
MRDVTATVTPGGAVRVEGFSGFAQEHNAARLIVVLNDELSAADISCHYLCFDLYGLARKINSNPIYDENGTPAYRQGSRLYCPLPQALTAGGELTVQVEGHRIVAGEPASIVKSGLFTLEFEPSLMGCDEVFDTDCDLRERLLAALASFEKVKSNVEVLTPEAYSALTIKRMQTFYLVDSDAPPEDDDEGEDDEPPLPIAVTGILLSPVTADVGVDSTVTLTATVVPSDAADKALTWATDNAAVATVSQNGTVTGRGEGIAKITVRSVDGGFTAFCSVQVSAIRRKLWQGSKTVNGITISISGGHVAMNGTKTVTDYPTGSLYFTDNVTDAANIADCPPWAVLNTGDVLALTVKNKTGTCNESGADLGNAACQLRSSSGTVLCGATWGNPVGTFTHTVTAQTPVLGLLCYLNSGKVVSNYTFDIELSVNGVRWI